MKVSHNFIGRLRSRASVVGVESRCRTFSKEGRVGHPVEDPKP